MRHLFLFIILTSIVFALPPYFVEANGDVFLDGKLIGSVNSSYPAYIVLPIIPGNHTLKIGNKTFTYHLFDINCSNLGKLKCEIFGHANFTMPVVVSCSEKVYQDYVEVENGKKIEIEAECGEDAEVVAGDWKATIPFTLLFKNSVDAGNGSWVYIFKNETLILKKWGKGIVGFPELEPGRYEVAIVGEKKLRGKLIVEKRVKQMMVGYAIAALVVLSSIVLLITD